MTTVSGPGSGHLRGDEGGVEGGGSGGGRGRGGARSARAARLAVDLSRVGTLLSAKAHVGISNVTRGPCKLTKLKVSCSVSSSV